MTDPYTIAHSDYRFDLPADFNFGFDVIDARAKETPGRIAYIAVDRTGEDIRPVTYADLAGASNRFANVLHSLDAAKGDFALVIMERIPAWFETLIGCMKVGVVAMPGTTLLTAKDIRYRINKTRARFVVVSSGHADKVEEIRADCPSLEHLIIVTNARNGWIHYESACVSQPAEIAPHQLEPTQADEMMLAYFTSGTTADPKLVPRDHSYAKAHEITGRFWLDLNDNDVHWTLSDTGWAKAAWGMLFGPWMGGAAIVLYDGDIHFDAVCHLKLIAKLRVSTFCAPPTVYRLFTQHDLTTYDLSSIRHSVSAGEPLNPEVIRVWKETTGTVVHDGYGQTETVNVVANFPFMPVRPGSMGKAAPGFTVSIVNDDGLPLSNNDIGHIAIKVTEPHPPGLFHGYYNGPNDLDRSSFRHGWYYTGDTAYCDNDGYIWFVGRSDDIISSASYRISPFEVESALQAHEAVAESAVIGKPDSLRGEIVTAYVVLATGFSASESLVSTLQDYVKSQTAPYKYPREIEFRKSLPKTISGKIRRVDLRAEAIAAATNHRC